MSGVNFNFALATRYVVRNDRTHYTENPKPAYDKVSSEGIVGYATTNYSKALDRAAAEINRAEIYRAQIDREIEALDRAAAKINRAEIDRAQIDREIDKLEEWIKNNKGGARAKAPTL
ncbi:hypothetical protein IJE86_09655 [bacterium]|nr:hypothetical protein [bacterium]